jgi:hypothetical protein
MEFNLQSKRKALMTITQQKRLILPRSGALHAAAAFAQSSSALTTPKPEKNS